ncbi:PucR family transcriptional regulator [Lapillicoccus sp.]|uniref:PucR family transcriptional regulator n=1 Tax=Lapillicoccus sp. TaxID=1909287 RepID=UPI0025E48C5D|nr:PucR family transcriptional regulator [Lapillicoccus sp.]
MVMALEALVASLGQGLVRLVVPRPGGPAVGDVTVVEPGEGWFGAPGDLVFGVGIPDAAAATDLIGRLAEVGSAGVVLRRDLARSRAVRAAARSHRLALVELDAGVALAHVLGLVRSILDRSTMLGPDAPDPGAHNDLFTLADAVAALVDAPVTIEDGQSRVLAYSSRQDVTDTARVSTIVGRRVPEALVAHFRARGLFRRLARSDEPFLVPPGPTQTLPRLVVPVRAGGEWLGSIWVVAEQLPPEGVLRELRQIATVLALQLLRVRAQADMTRRISADRLRTALTDNGSEAVQWLSPGPWRVVALSRPEDSDDASHDLDVWESIFRRRQWQQPLITDLDGVAWAVVTTDQGRPGTWDWLADVVGSEATADPSLHAVAGSAVTVPSRLRRSREEASELAELHATGRIAGPVVRFDDAWQEVTLARAAAAVGARRGTSRARGRLAPDSGGTPRSEPLLGGPLPELAAHDAAHGTAYLATLAAHLDHPTEPTRAAGALHVHPNTLRYRLGRMAEVAPLTLDDPTMRLVLRLQLAALGHLPT